MQTMEVVEMGRTKVFGGAGCGKTYYLMSELTKLLESGTHINDVCMLTMTRNGAAEFKSRAMKVTGLKSPSDLRLFGTMHSIMWKLLGLTRKNIPKRDVVDSFLTHHGIANHPNLHAKLRDFDSTRRNCMQPCNEEGVLVTQTLTGMNPMYTDDVSGLRRPVPYTSIIDYGEAWGEYMEDREIYDFNRIIEKAREGILDGSVPITFTKLFADEFQDFSPLQHELYTTLADHVDDDWVCGDDLQVIFRYSGASPAYLINDVCDEEVVLPRTYRYGYEILKNADKYVTSISVKKERDITPSEKVSNVDILSGDSWINHIHESEGTTAYLVRTGQAISQITSILDQKGIMYALLGQSMSKIEALISCYNTIANLEGGRYTPAESVRELVLQMAAMTPTTQSVIEGDVKRVQYLIPGVKSDASNEEWFFQDYPLDYYTTETFSDTFLKSRTWRLLEVAGSVQGLVEFVSKKGIIFPNPVEGMIKDFVGTIHKFKGNEADNVFLFAQIPFPIPEEMRKSVEKRDDELRTFYVGATRPRTNLYEVKDYLYDRFGSLHCNMDGFLGGGQCE